MTDLIERIINLAQNNPELREILNKIDEAKHLGGLGLHRTIRDPDLFVHKLHYPKQFKRSLGRARMRTAPQVSRLVSKFDKEMKGNLSLIHGYSKAHKLTGARRSLHLTKSNSVSQALKNKTREYYHRAFRLGVESSGVSKLRLGGQVDDLERKWVDSAVTQEMKYLNRLLKEVQKGKDPSLLKRRIDLYPKVLQAMYDAGRVASSHPDTLFYWKVDPSKQNCGQCLELERMSPFVRENLPCVPRSGVCACLSNCGCEIIIKPSTPAEVEEVRRSSFRKGTILRKIRKLR